MTPETRASAPAPESPAPSRARATTWQSVPLAGVITIYGLTMAGLTPTLSLFLANAVHTVPFLIGLFFTVFALAGIAVGLVTGWLSDRMRDRRALMFAAGLSGAISALCLALLRDYALILVACAVFGGLGQSFFGQVFAYTNEFAHAHERDVTAYSAAMRSVFSAGYVIGPPLALSVMARYGFRPLYLSVAVSTLAAAIIGRWGLRPVPPRVPPRVRSRTAGGGAWRVLRGGLSLSARTWFLLGVVLLFSMVIQMYNIDISSR